MGMYTGVRFKGFVKPEFREDAQHWALEGNWEDSKNEALRTFGEKDGRASFIPCGSICYMPNSWYKKDPAGKSPQNPLGILYREDPDEFVRSYDPETGYWVFQCSLKNYDDTIEWWLNLVPIFIESVEHLEVFYEEWHSSQGYTIKDDHIECISDEFVLYDSEEEDDD